MPKTANFSVGKCSRCGRITEVKSITFCDYCWKHCERCGGPLKMLGDLSDKAVAQLRETFGLGRDVVGVCLNCIQETLAFPARIGVSRRLPVEVTLTSHTA